MWMSESPDPDKSIDVIDSLERTPPFGCRLDNILCLFVCAVSENNTYYYSKYYFAAASLSLSLHTISISAKI